MIGWFLIVSASFFFGLTLALLFANHPNAFALGVSAGAALLCWTMGVLLILPAVLND